MDDLYAINVVKSEFRECFNLGHASRMRAIADRDLVTFSDGQPSEFGESGLDSFKTRLTNLFERFTVTLAVIVNEVRLQGNVGYDYGWHDLTLTPEQGANPSGAETATWTFGGKTKKVSGSYGCTWSTRTLPIHLCRSRLRRSGRTFTEASEAFCIAAC